MATNRAEREVVLTTKLGRSLKGLTKDPCLTAYLDAMDQADAEGLNQMVEAFIAEIKRSGNPQGFIVELDVATALAKYPRPRKLICEKLEGAATSPGDIWLEVPSARLEFQCKNILNWNVDLYVRNAMDAIERSEIAQSSRGLFYELEPTVDGTEEDWRRFVSWTLENFGAMKLGKKYLYTSEGREIAHITLTNAPDTGLRWGSSWSPGMLHRADNDLMKYKLSEAFKKARVSYSALPSETHFNFLVARMPTSMIEGDDFFQALYGELKFQIVGNEAIPSFDWNGLYHSYANFTRSLSGVIVLDHVECDPMDYNALVFPNPNCKDAVAKVLEPLENFEVIINYSQVDVL